MKKVSDRTKHCKTMYIIFSVLHFLCLFGPFLYYIPYGFINGTPVEKVGLSLIIILSLCLAAFALFVDVKSRAGMPKTIMWILIVGILFCIQKVEIFIYIMAAVAIVDELIVVRFKAKYKDIYAANKEIDRRE